MTPQLDHQGMEVIDVDECWALAATRPVGRVAFVESGEPVVLPVNHTVSGHRILFRTARGALLEEAMMNRPVAFEVDDFDTASRSGWSVLVRGVARPSENDEIAGVDLDAWADSIERDNWVTLLAEEITGRRIRHP